MKMILTQVLLLVATYVQVECLYEENIETSVARVRRQQPGSGYATGPLDPNRIYMTFMNKAGRSVRVFQSNEYGYEIIFRFLLRPNEPRSVSFTPDGSFWVAYDEEKKILLLMNGQQRMESVRMIPGRTLNVKIHSATLPPEPLPKGKLEPRFIETLVVLDNSMVKHHGAHLMKYVLTLMNTVARAYMHRSLNVPIFIAVTGIVTMTTVPEYYKLSRTNPDVSVRSACRYAWSHAGNYSFDFALTLTRQDIGPEGYASMYTMCTKKSCALVRETNPDSAYVIAHEIGHALGIDHDEEDGCERDNVAGGNIMVKKIFTTSSNHQWSRCSKKMLLQNLKYLDCLNNKPKLLPAFERSLLDLPGENFGMSEQCTKYHGPKAIRCDNNILTGCRYLWCRKAKGSPCQPLWWHTPLEGSSCSPRKWCIRGRCVRKRKKYPVNGGWSNWTNFTAKCDSKKVKTWIIQKSNRSCTNPSPINGGTQCTGEIEQHRMMLPNGNDSCIPYSFASLVLSRDIDIKALRTGGCELSKHKKKIWKEYSTDDQKNYLKRFNLACDFEKSNCSWKSSDKGVKPWRLGRGKTPSARTGPQADHTLNTTKGHYLYFEASWGEGTRRLKSGDRVILESPLILSPAICLKFAYHMYGQHVKGLEVIIHNGKHKRKMWYKYGNQGNKWHMAQIDLPINVEYKLTIEAIRGQSYYSDIAIDDIEVTHGLCIKDRPVEKVCTSVCVDVDHTAMYRQQQKDGTPCGKRNVPNAVCFNKMCQPVNCLGIIGKNNC